VGPAFSPIRENVLSTAVGMTPRSGTPMTNTVGWYIEKFIRRSWKLMSLPRVRQQ